MEKLWSPTKKRIEQSSLKAFLKASGLPFKATDYQTLYDWSVENPQNFWSELKEFCQVEFSKEAESVLQAGSCMREAKWFPGATLNFARELLKKGSKEKALIFHSEDKVKRTLSYQDLREQVSRVAQAFRAIGVGKGDRVAAFIPNMPEAIICMLATTSIGAVWSSCSPDFGVTGVIDRFGQIEPKVLICADGYYHKGKHHESLSKVGEILKGIPSIEQVLVCSLIDHNSEIEADCRVQTYDNFIQAYQAKEIEYTEVPFDHPTYILFSSGTTGKPKCIVHGAGGTLLAHCKELVLHCDLKESDVFFYQTTCGWMMWNMLVSGLVTGSTLVLYDGAPFHKDGRILWQIAQEEGITIFGTNAKYIAALEKHGVKPGSEFNLSSVHSVLSTGSPLLPENFDYIYRDVKEDVCLASITGGTDIVGLFAGGCPTLPVYRGEIQCRCLALDVAVLDESGKEVSEEKGELVCRAPFPNMPVCFWNDPEGERYHHSYFGREHDYWYHGDYVELTKNGGLIMYGRSDAVLNPGGIRIGTAEIYRQVEKIESVQEAIVVGQKWEDDVRVVLFVVLNQGVELDEALQKKICTEIRSGASPFHVPKKILQVPEIPRTRSGKIVEIAVREVVNGKEIQNIEAIANPEALEHFRNRKELQA